MKNIFAFILSIGVLGSIQAQRGWELGGWLGTSIYYGDLNTSVNFSNPGISGGINARFNLNTRVCLMSSFNYGRLRGTDANADNNFELNRNLSFKSSIFDLRNVIEFNFFPYIHGSEEYYFTPYLFGGINFFSYSPYAELNEEWYELRELGTEGQNIGSEYGIISGGLLMGLGVKWDLSSDLSFNLFASYSRTYTDYLDDVSTVYPDNQYIMDTRGPIAAALSDRSLIDGLGNEGRQRGDQTNRDGFAFIGLSFMKYFGRLNCPPISDIR